MPAVTRLYGHYVETSTATFDETRPTLAEMHRRRSDIIDRGLPYLAAEDIDGTLLGFAYASPFRDRAAYRFTVEDSVYVAQDAQRGGVGRSLLSKLVSQCETAGYRQMVAVIGDSANTASIALHIRCGFRQVGLMPAVGYKFGRWIDSVRMQRALGAGDNTAPTEPSVNRTKKEGP